MTPAPPRRAPAGPVTLAGTGLFTGRDASVTIRPPVNPTDHARGIILRTRAAHAPATVANLSDAPAHPAFATLKPRCTSVRVAPDHTVATVEHLLSALAGMGITDADIEAEGPEIPILDGSALPFVRALHAVGLRALDNTVRPITLERPIELRTGDTLLIAEPADAIDYAYHLDFGPGSPIPPGEARWDGDPARYAAEIAPARTFATLADAQAMRAVGLFARFTPADLLVIGPQGPIDNAWRLPDECARHKLLDLIGDLALLGRPLIARVRAHKTGHAHTHELCRRILDHAG